MFTLRQLSARINTTSLSMGVIALILFLAITSVTGGMSICNAMSGNIEQHTPVDASVSIVFYGDHPASSLEGDDGTAVATATQDFAALMAGAGYDLGTVGDTCQLTVYSAANQLDDPGSLTLSAIHAATGAPLPAGMENSNSDTTGLDLMAQSNYNAWRAFLGLEPVELGQNGYLLTCDMGNQIVDFYNGMLCRLPRLHRRPGAAARSACGHYRPFRRPIHQQRRLERRHPRGARRGSPGLHSLRRLCERALHGGRRRGRRLRERPRRQL